MVRASGESIGTGGGRLAAGKCHLLVTKAEEHTAKSGNTGIRLELEVLGHVVEGQEQKTMKYQDLYGGRMFDFAAAVGLTDHITGEVFTPTKLAAMRAMQKENEAAKKANKNPPHVIPDADFDPGEAENRTFCGEIKYPKPTNEKPDPWPELGFWMVSPYDPEAKDVPKDARYVGETVGAGTSAPSGDAAFD